MKKRKFKSLNINKNVVSNLLPQNLEDIKGGAGGTFICSSGFPPVLCPAC